MEIVTLLLSIPAILIALTVHEYAHGYAAWKLGDPTARSLGRLSLNPLSHIDPIGAICLLLFRFGWAKPVPINARYFKKPRRDLAITALSGPLANFALSFLSALLFVSLGLLLLRLSPFFESSRLLTLFLEYTLDFLLILHSVNLTLGLFNCLPVPPLDGSRFLLFLLPRGLYFKVMKYERLISLILLLLLITGLLHGVLVGAAEWISSGIFSLFYKIFGLL